jgi:hypothetical protein
MWWAQLIEVNYNIGQTGCLTQLDERERTINLEIDGHSKVEQTKNLIFKEKF